MVDDPIDAIEVLDEDQFQTLNILVSNRQELKQKEKECAEQASTISAAIKEQLIALGYGNIQTPEWSIKLVGKEAPRKLDEGLLQAAMMEEGITADVVGRVLSKGWKEGKMPEPYVDVRARENGKKR